MNNFYLAKIEFFLYFQILYVFFFVLLNKFIMQRVGCNLCLLNRYNFISKLSYYEFRLRYFEFRLPFCEFRLRYYEVEMPSRCYEMAFRRFEMAFRRRQMPFRYENKGL